MITKTIGQEVYGARRQTVVKPLWSQHTIDLRETQPAYAVAAAIATHDMSESRVRQGSRVWFRRLIKAAIMLAGVVTALSTDWPLPERFIAIYFVAAMVYKIAVRQTVLVSMIFLAMFPLWSVAVDPVAASNYAVYSFYFLLIGMASLVREMAVQQ